MVPPAPGTTAVGVTNGLRGSGTTASGFACTWVWDAPTLSNASFGLAGAVGGGGAVGCGLAEITGGCGGVAAASILGGGWILGCSSFGASGTGAAGRASATGPGAGCGARKRGACGRGRGSALRTSRSRDTLPLLGAVC